MRVKYSQLINYEVMYWFQTLLMACSALNKNFRGLCFLKISSFSYLRFDLPTEWGGRGWGSLEGSAVEEGRRIRSKQRSLKRVAGLVTSLPLKNGTKLCSSRSWFRLEIFAQFTPSLPIKILPPLWLVTPTPLMCHPPRICHPLWLFNPLSLTCHNHPNWSVTPSVLSPSMNGRIWFAPIYVPLGYFCLHGHKFVFYLSHKGWSWNAKGW